MKRLLPLFAILALVIVPADQPAAQQVSWFADIKLYQAVIDRLFHSEPPVGTAQERVRYTSGDSGEMQIVIRHEEGGQLRLELWRLPRESPTVWERLSALWNTVPALTVDERRSDDPLVLDGSSAVGC